MTYEQFWQPLTTLYDAAEARAVARMVLELRFGLTMTDVLCGQAERIPDGELRPLQHRLLQGEPVQYVLGVAEFGPRTFAVGPGVLIPRPETYELCQWVAADLSTTDAQRPAPTILDVGTGSGCIACTLAAELPRARVTAWDVSAEALTIARQNAKRAHVLVSFAQVDVLAPPPSSFDVIVSNPPYICEREKAAMQRNVLDHEPHLALFVPDDDPLLFYCAIARYAVKALPRGGSLYFEINSLYARQTEELLRQAGFIQIETRRDQFGRERFTKAILQ